MPEPQNYIQQDNSNDPIESVDRLLATIKTLHAAHEQSEHEVAERLAALETWERRVAARLRETWQWVDGGPFAHHEHEPCDDEPGALEREIDASVRMLVRAREKAQSYREQAAEAKIQRDQALEQVHKLMEQLAELDGQLKGARAERDGAVAHMEQQRQQMEAAGIEIHFESPEQPTRKPKRKAA